MSIQEEKTLDDWWDELEDCYIKTLRYYHIVFMPEDKPWELGVAKSRKQLIQKFMEKIGDKEWLAKKDKMHYKYYPDGNDYMPVHMTMGFMAEVTDNEITEFINEYFAGPKRFLVIPARLEKAERADLSPNIIPSHNFQTFNVVTLNVCWAEYNGIIGP